MSKDVQPEGVIASVAERLIAGPSPLLALVAFVALAGLFFTASRLPGEADRTAALARLENRADTTASIGVPLRGSFDAQAEEP